jgi:hypothetical protein
VTRRPSAFAALLTLALTATLLFLTIPVVAIFADTSPGRLLDSLQDPSATDALWLSLKTSLTALVIVAVVGTPAAYALATRRFRGRAVLITLIELPLVLPPAVAGIGLLAAVGPNGIFGPALGDAGIRFGLQTSSVVLALVFVAAPFHLRQAQSAFEAPARPGRSCTSRSRPRHPAWSPGSRWPGVGRWGSSGRRSCSPARSAASPRPRPWRSTTASRPTSTAPSPSRRCSSRSRPRCC